MGSIILKSDFNYFVNAVKKAEELGFQAVFLPDHYMQPKNNVMYEAWTALTALALQTETIRLASCVTPIPFYRPSDLAKRVASLDHISDGRVIFGAGCGWNENEFNAYNVPFDPFRTRVQKMLEGIELIKALWTTKGPVNYSGNHYRIDNAELLPKPRQEPHPPIWFGGSSTQILNAVAKHGKGWIPSERTTLYVYREKVELLQKLVRKVGRDPADITPAIARMTVVASSLKEVKAAIKRLSLTSEGSDNVIQGTPKDCISRIHQFIEAGARHFAVGVFPPEKVLEGIQLYSEEIIPYI
jgi:probable F420-dependent oxidoreductase